MSATSACSSAAVAAVRGGSRGGTGVSGRAHAGVHRRRLPVRCQAVNGSSQQQKKNGAGAEILRNGGSAAPTPPPAPAARQTSSPSTNAPPAGAQSFSADVANDAIAFNKPTDNNTALGRPVERSRDVLTRAREIMSVDPEAPSALNLIGSKVDVKVEFKVQYETKLGEDLYVIGSHDKLGAWDQINAVPMIWGEGGNWSATLDLPAGG